MVCNVHIYVIVAVVIGKSNEDDVCYGQKLSKGTQLVTSPMLYG
jgi:hypothetical protein